MFIEWNSMGNLTIYCLLISGLIYSDNKYILATPKLTRQLRLSKMTYDIWDLLDSHGYLGDNAAHECHTIPQHMNVNTVSKTPRPHEVVIDYQSSCCCCGSIAQSTLWRLSDMNLRGGIWRTVQGIDIFLFKSNFFCLILLRFNRETWKKNKGNVGKTGEKCKNKSVSIIQALKAKCKV